MLTDLQESYYNIVKENQNRRLLKPAVLKCLGILKPLIGQKVCKADNSLLKKVKEELDKAVESSGLHNQDKVSTLPIAKDNYASISRLIVYSDGYSIRIGFSISYSGGKYEDHTYYCSYYDSNIWLGTIRNQVLESMLEANEDYFLKNFQELNADQEVEQYKKVLALKKEYEEEKDKLFYRNREFLKR